MNKLIIFLSFLLFLSNCNKEDINEKVATPVYSPADSLHSVFVYVEINCETEGAIIYYTLNGNDPTSFSNVYNTPVLIKSSTTIKSFATKKGMDDSPVAIKTYTINALLEWQKLYGGSDWDQFKSIQQTSDGGYIVAGESQSTDITGLKNHGSTDYYVVKLNTGGNIEWQQMYGGNSWDATESIQQTNDGGYIIAGKSESTNITGVTNYGADDCYIIKINSSGVTEWQKMFGSNESDGPVSIMQMDDGGYLIAALYYDGDVNSRKEPNLIKLDSDGNKQYQRKFSGLNNCFDNFEMVRCMKLTKDGGCIIAGCLTSPGSSFYSKPWNIFLVKLNSNAGKEWQQTINGKYPFAGGISSIEQINDGSYIVAGRYEIADDLYDGYIMKISAGGNKTWQQIYGGSESDMFNSIYETNEGSYIIAGYSFSADLDNIINNGSSDAYILKMYKWQQLYGGSGWDEFKSIQQTTDGGYIAAGYSGSTDISGALNHGSDDGYIIKISGDK